VRGFFFWSLLDKTTHPGRFQKIKYAFRKESKIEIHLLAIFPHNLHSSPRGEGGENEPGRVHKNDNPRHDDCRDDGEGAIEAISPVPILGGGDHSSLSHS
jgi:hypothetical protein